MKVSQFSLLVVAMLVASQASAAAPSDVTLAAMGLSGLQVMSDSEGLAVRGFGYSGTSANGKSWAHVQVEGGSAGSQNSYSAKGGRYSAGASGSVAGVEVETSGGHGGGHDNKGSKGGGHGSKPKDVSVVAFSGGFSVGKTKN